MAAKRRTIKKSVAKTRASAGPRIHRSQICFNDIEMRYVEYYCRKYKVKYKAKFFREAVIDTILRTLEEDYPTLF